MDNLSDIQLADILNAGDDQTAQQRATTLAAALRRQQASAQDQQAGAGLAGFFNTPAATTMGKAYGEIGAQQYEAAGGQLKQLDDVPKARLRLALERQQQVKGQRENDVAGARAEALGDPGSVTSKVRTGLAGQLGLDVPEGSPGNAIDDKELELAQRFRTGQERNAIARQRVAAVAAQAGQELSPEALQQQAEAYLATGQLPTFGTGRTGGMIKTAIANRAAGMSPTASLAGNKASYKANTGSLTKQQGQLDLIESKENTALANLDLAVSKAKAIPDFGTRWANKPLRALAASTDPAQAAFATALSTAANEAAGVLRGSNTITEGARHELDAMLNPDATVAQLIASTNVLKQDMANRKRSSRGQLEETRGRLTGAQHPTDAEPAAVQMRFPDGSTHPVPADKIEKARLKGAVPVGA